MVSASSTITNSMFIGNILRDSLSLETNLQGGGGAGLALSLAVSIRISETKFIDNSLFSCGNGYFSLKNQNDSTPSAFFSFYKSDPTLLELIASLRNVSKLVSSSSDGSSGIGGAGVFIVSPTFTFDHCHFEGNSLSDSSNAVNVVSSIRGVNGGSFVGGAGLFAICNDELGDCQVIHSSFERNQISNISSVNPDPLSLGMIQSDFASNSAGVFVAYYQKGSVEGLSPSTCSSGSASGGAGAFAIFVRFEECFFRNNSVENSCTSIDGCLFESNGGSYCGGGGVSQVPFFSLFSVFRFP